MSGLKRTILLGGVAATFAGALGLGAKPAAADRYYRNSSHKSSCYQDYSCHYRAPKYCEPRYCEPECDYRPRRCYEPNYCPPPCDYRPRCPRYYEDD